MGVSIRTSIRFYCLYYQYAPDSLSVSVLSANDPLEIWRRPVLYRSNYRHDAPLVTADYTPGTPATFPAAASLIPGPGGTAHLSGAEL